MAQHVEINPDNESLLFRSAKAVRLASTQKTHKTGTVRILPRPARISLPVRVPRMARID